MPLKRLTTSYVLILWTTLQLYFQPSLGVVHQLYSSISTVGRTHGCVGELLTFTCATSGAWMEWKVAVGMRSFRFIESNSVNKVLTNTDITAILLEIYENGTPGERNFTSVIFIKLTHNTLPSNITCSSSTEIFALNYSIAELPQPPKFTNVSHLGAVVTNNTVQYRIQWLPPRNIREFDLDYYEVIIGNQTMNIDAKENEVIISIKKETTPIVVNIIAVDRCGTKSAIRSKPIPVLSIPGGLGNSSGTSATNCTCTKELASSITVTLFFSLMAVVISVLITRKMSKGPDSIPKDDDEMNRRPSTKPRNEYIALEGNAGDKDQSDEKTSVNRDLEGLHQKKKRSKYAGDQAQSDEETESENRVTMMTGDKSEDPNGSSESIEDLSSSAKGLNYKALQIMSITSSLTSSLTKYQAKNNSLDVEKEDLLSTSI